MKVYGLVNENPEYNMSFQEFIYWDDNIIKINLLKQLPAFTKFTILLNVPKERLFGFGPSKYTTMSQKNFGFQNGKDITIKNWHSIDNPSLLLDDGPTLVKTESYVILYIPPNDFKSYEILQSVLEEIINMHKTSVLSPLGLVVAWFLSDQQNLSVICSLPDNINNSVFGPVKYFAYTAQELSENVNITGCVLETVRFEDELNLKIKLKIDEIHQQEQLNENEIKCLCETVLNEVNEINFRSSLADEQYIDRFNELFEEIKASLTEEINGMGGIMRALHSEHFTVNISQ